MIRETYTIIAIIILIVKCIIFTVIILISTGLSINFLDTSQTSVCIDKPTFSEDNIIELSFLRDGEIIT